MSDPKAPTQVGQSCPTGAGATRAGWGVGPTEFRGVAIDQDSGIIYGSDMRSGLWILRPSGEAAG